VKLILRGVPQLLEIEEEGKDFREMLTIGGSDGPTASRIGQYPIRITPLVT